MGNTEKSFDSQLTLRLQAGDEAAFREAFDLYGQKIFGLAYHFLKNREQSREVVQETMLKLWERRENINATLPLAPYLYTIARHTTLNMLRQLASSRSATEKLWRQVCLHHNETEETVISTDLQRIAEKALQELPWQQQQVFRLSRLEGLTYEEIALRMGISAHTVKYHLSNALKTLRKQFAQTEIVFLFFLFFLLP